MTITIAFLLVAIGIALHALHTYICRAMEDSAWKAGFQQASKEEQIRLSTQERVNKKLTLPAQQHTMPEFRTGYPVYQQMQQPQQFGFPQIPEDFMDDLHSRGGRATMRIK